MAVCEESFTITIRIEHMKVRPALKPRKSPTQQRSKVTVDAICEATLHVLFRDGYSQLTTTRVAEVAGVSIGSLYQYFPNKKALIAEVMRRHLGGIVKSVLTELESNQDQEVEQLVAILIKTFIDAKLARVKVTRALMAPLAEIDGQNLVRQAAAQIVAPMCATLTRRAEMSPQKALMLSTILLGAVEGVVSATIDSDPDRLRVQAFRDAVVGLGISYVRWALNQQPQGSPHSGLTSRQAD